MSGKYGFDTYCHEKNINDPDQVIDFRKAKADGIDFILPRDGWGSQKIDPKFVEYVRGALEAGIEVPGVYHFIYGINIAEAIQNAVRAIKNVQAAGLPQDTVIWCDIEDDTVENAKTHRGVDLSPKDIRNMAEAFCNFVLAEGYPAGIYCNKDYICNIYGTDIVDKYDIWLADLDGEPDFPCVYRQYDWHGKPKGCKKDVDLDEYVGIHTACTSTPRVKETKDFSGNGKETVKMSKYQIMTDDQWVEKLKTLARGKSNYKAAFPWNLLYWDGTRFWSDCSNLEKALFNGRDINNKKVGSYAWPLTATGDCSEYALLMQCADVQWGAFGSLKAGEPRILYQEGHIGAYLGEEWEEPGQGIVNCVESTPAWEDGIQFSYVAPNGARSWCKGGAVRSYWEAHGLASKWVAYTDGNTQKTVQEAIQTVSGDVKGNHYGTSDLAVMIIRNKYGNGSSRRKNLSAEGYTDEEINAAQNLVNSVVRKANEQKAEAEKALTVITAAYDVIAGAYGDGEERRTGLIGKYGEETYGQIRNKVEELLS